MQPRPLEAFELQGHIAAAIGDSARFILAEFFADPDQAADFEAERVLLSEAKALQTIRNARAGRGLFISEDPVPCTDRLWSVLHLATARSGGRLDALRLLGESTPGRGGGPAVWGRPSLLHRLLLASGLRFDGEGDQPLGPLPDGPIAPPTPGQDPVAYAEAFRMYEMNKRRAALRDAVAEGSLTAFTRALDDLLISPDEAALLCAWAVLHLWRPF